jgi:carbamoylphosphate synthase large subunit
VVVKIPRFAFEKFPEADPSCTSTMKSVGEVMAIGRTFKEALGKAWRALERGDRPPARSTASIRGASRPPPRAG